MLATAMGVGAVVILQPDPSAAEVNLYAYAGNSPVTKVDPSGTAAIAIPVVVCLALSWCVAALAAAPRGRSDSLCM